MKILHLISGLEVGGAEMMLLNLLKQPDFALSVSRVVSLTSIGTLGARIQQMGIVVEELKMRRSQPSLTGLLHFINSIHLDSPDLIQSWMYHADLFGSLAAKLSGNIPIVWGIHHTLDGKHPVSRKTKGVLQANAYLSKWIPRRIICCAVSARDAHIKAGYSSHKMLVIPNGIDTNEFHPDHKARLDIRNELGLAPTTPLIGMFARFHPQKDHQTFATAAGILHDFMPNVHFILAGEGINTDNNDLRDLFISTGITAQTHLLGLRNDMPRLMAGVDISCLSSAFGEALPLSIAESMACGVPCVVTDIGDSRSLVGTTGRIVQPGDPHALSNALEEILRLPPRVRLSLGKKARTKISLEYNIVSVANLYTSLYKSILEDVSNEKTTTAHAQD